VLGGIAQPAPNGWVWFCWTWSKPVARRARTGRKELQPDARNDAVPSRVEEGGIHRRPTTAPIVRPEVAALPAGSSRTAVDFSDPAGS